MHHHNQLPALFVGKSTDPLSLDIMSFAPGDLEHFWPLHAEVARAFPASDFKGDPISDPQAKVSGIYSSPHAMVGFLGAAGFRQGGIYQTAGGERKIVGHAALHESRHESPTAEIKVHIFDKTVRAASEIALYAIARLAGHVIDDLDAQAVQADVMAHDASLVRSYKTAGFTHRPSVQDFNTIACGSTGDEFSHIETMELRRPAHIPSTESADMKSQLESGWNTYTALRRHFVKW
jgi:hypothetical protein